MVTTADHPPFLGNLDCLALAQPPCPPADGVLPVPVPVPALPVGGPIPFVLAQQARGNTAAATVVAADATASNLGAIGNNQTMTALNNLRLKVILDAVFRATVGLPPITPLSAADLPFYYSLLSDLDLSLASTINKASSIGELVSQVAGQKQSAQAQPPPMPSQQMPPQQTPPQQMPPSQMPPPPSQPTCVLCNVRPSSRHFKGKPVCSDCVSELVHPGVQPDFQVTVPARPLNRIIHPDVPTFTFDSRSNRTRSHQPPRPLEPPRPRRVIS